MDKIDREIIDFLRSDARISYKDLGEKVFLSANAVAERMRRLEQAGVIQAYQARISLQALDLSLVALIDIKLAPGTTAVEFESTMRGIPGIIEATLMTGSFDYMLRVACVDQAALVQIVERLRAKGGVQESYTRVILRSIDLNTALPR